MGERFRVGEYVGELIPAMGISETYWVVDDRDHSTITNSDRRWTRAECVAIAGAMNAIHDRDPVASLIRFAKGPGFWQASVEAPAESRPAGWDSV